MEITEGSIIFVSRRKGSFLNPRVILTWLIAYFSDRENIDTVPTHTAIIFRIHGNLYVRDMDYDGDSEYPLEQYKQDYAGRIRIKINPHDSDYVLRKQFNNSCANTFVHYDFANLVFFQVLRLIFKRLFWFDTIKHRICSEDTARMFNILVPYRFRNPEEITPKIIDQITKNWILER